MKGFFNIFASTEFDCPGDGTCSDQGTCDDATGTCVCFQGFERLSGTCKGKVFCIFRPKKWLNIIFIFLFLQINLVLVVLSLVITMVNVITQLVNAFVMKVIKALIALVTQNTVKLLAKTYDFSALMHQNLKQADRRIIIASGLAQR